MKPEGAVEKFSKGSSRGLGDYQKTKSGGGIGEVSGNRRVYCCRGLVQLMGEKVMAKEMTIESHKGDSRGSERGHNRKREKENAKENGIR